MLLYTFGLTIFFISIWNAVSLRGVSELRCTLFFFFFIKERQTLELSLKVLYIFLRFEAENVL